jgi:hypothetical protein
MCVVAIPSAGMRFADARPHRTLRALHEFDSACAASLWIEAGREREAIS